MVLLYELLWNKIFVDPIVPYKLCGKENKPKN